MRGMFFLFVTIIIFQPINAHAYSCMLSHEKNLIQQNDLIFKGKAKAIHENKVDKEPDSFTTFEVSEIIKGAPETPIKVYHTRQSRIAGGSFSFKLDDEAYFFARRAHNGNYYVTGPCTPAYYISDIKKYDHYAQRIKTIQVINDYQALKKSADKSIEEFGSYQSYLEKGKLLEEYNDYEQAKILYEETLKKILESRKSAPAKGGIQSFDGHKIVMFGASRPSDSSFQDICTGVYGIKDFTPEFLKPFNDGFGRKSTLMNTDSLHFYARTLYNLNQYEQAFRPLCLLGQRATGESLSLKTKILAVLGIKDELNNKPLNLSQSKLNMIDLSDLRIERSDFSKSDLSNINFSKSILIGSDFSESKIKRININGANLSGSIVDKANISGDLTNSDLSYVKGTETKLGGDLIGSDLTGADLNGVIIYGDLNGANLEKANLEGASIYKLSGAKLKNTNLNHINSRSNNFRRPSDFIKVDLSGFDLSGSDLSETNFGRSKFVNTKLVKANLTGSKLRDTDFKGADLSGADLSSSRYGQTDLSGADFSSANIKGTIWNGGRYDCRTKFPSGFNPANFFLVTTDKSCETKTDIDYSWNKLLSPPVQHYRILPNGSLSNFENINMDDANFEGGHLYLQDPKAFGFNGKKNESRAGKTTFRKVSLKNANFKNSVGEFDFFGVDLEGADFSYSNIRVNSHYATYEPTNVKGAKFYCTNMKEIRTKFLNIEDADLTAAIYNSLNVGEWKKEYHNFNPIKKKVLFRFMQKIIDEYGPADYSSMSFDGCDLTDIDFGSTNLSGSTFKGAYFYRTSFNSANLEGANFDSARITNSAKLPSNIDVSKHKLIPTQILNGNTSPWAASDGGVNGHLISMYSPPRYEIPDFVEEDLSKTVFLGAWLPNSNISGSDIRFSDFTASNLSGANLSNVKAKGVVFYDAVLSNADLSGADLQGVDLRWTDLKGANLKNANLQGSIYDFNTVWPDGFDPEQAGAFLLGAKEKPVDLPEIPESHKFKSLSSDVEIISLGFYRIRSGCGHSEDTSCTIKVKIPDTGKSVLLVLSAYEPSNWDIVLDSGAKLEGVILSGLYPQTIQGVPGNVKVVNYSDRKEDHRLKFYVYDQKKVKDVEKMNTVVKALTGKKVSKIVGQYNMENYIIE